MIPIKVNAALEIIVNAIREEHVSFYSTGYDDGKVDGYEQALTAIIEVALRLDN